MRMASQMRLGLVVLIAVFAYSGCGPNGTEADALSPADEEQLAASFEKLEVIGEGTHFLTAKIDLPRAYSADIQFYGLVLDEDGYPLSKVSGYTHDPQLEGQNHLWFFFFAYAPGEWPAFQRNSGFIQFVVAKGEKVILEKIVEHRKSWGSPDEPEIFDRPSPPDEIAGCILLKDYAFLAQGDYRKPQGYHVEGKIVGHDGVWTHFVVLSDVLGQEDEPEIRLETDRGWLELTTGKSHSMPEAIAPAPPYVQGWWDGKGYFHPEPVRVFGLKLD